MWAFLEIGQFHLRVQVSSAAQSSIGLITAPGGSSMDPLQLQLARAAVRLRVFPPSATKGSNEPIPHWNVCFIISIVALQWDALSLHVVDDTVPNRLVVLVLGIGSAIPRYNQQGWRRKEQKFVGLFCLMVVVQVLIKVTSRCGLRNPSWQCVSLKWRWVTHLLPSDGCKGC